MPASSTAIEMTGTIDDGQPFHQPLTHNFDS